ncbi:MAG: alpha/beta hydrolase [Microbacteriaceae bacterium]
MTVQATTPFAKLSNWLNRRRPTVLHIAGDVGAGPVAVLIHGIASSSVTFQNLVPLLRPHKRTISIDILGFGESVAPPGTEYTIEEHVAALHATIRSLDLASPFVLVGHSLGALIASRYAAVHQNRVAKLVLVGPPIYLAPTEIGDRRVRARVETYLRVYNFLRENKTFTLRNAAVIARLMPIKNVFEVTEDNWDAFVKSMKNCIEQQTLISDVATVHVPVEVVYGSLDAFIAPGSMTVIERMRHVTVHRVKINDHLIRRRLARVVARAIG